MCTVSWFRWAGGFELYFSRDELRVRARGEGPSLNTAPSGVRYLAPRDPDASGTWITVNEYGTAVCLLNRYPLDGFLKLSAPGSSRGALVRLLADVQGVDLVEARLREIDLADYLSFTLLVLDPQENVRRMVWDGSVLTCDADPTSPLASSGHSPRIVEATRRETWAEFCDPDDGSPDDSGRSARLLAFHQSHLPNRGALSPCMHRKSAHTVSLCHVNVSSRRVDVAYADGAPCREPLGSPLTLARAGQHALA